MTFKIDTHTHIMPEKMPNFMKKFGYGGFIRLEHKGPCKAHMVRDDGKFFRAVSPNCWSPSARLADCDQHQVDVQVLSTIPVLFSYWAKPRDGWEVSRFLNDHIAETVATYPTRFVGLGTLPMQAPDLALRELERCKTELNFKGIEIGSHVNRWNLNDPNLFPIFKACEELDLAVFVHPWDMMGMERMPQYWLPWLVGMPAETSLAICSMIFGGVFERLPQLRVCFAHGGGSFPATIGRIEHGFQVRPDLCQVHSQTNPRHYLGRFYLDSLVHDASALRYLLDLVGDRRIMLGSDYPFPLGEHKPGQLIDAAFSEQPTIRRRLHYQNAVDWLQLDLTDYSEE